MKELDICVVIVTYNRLEKLKKALKSYEDATCLPKKMIIVDNGSDDGTGQFLSEWHIDEGIYEKELILLSENTGGSGGFYEGIRRGMQSGCRWIWVADDDAYPSIDCFEQLEPYMNHDYVALCSEIISPDGIDTWHRRRIEKHLFTVREPRVDISEYGSEFEINLFSYVGTLLLTSAVEKAGLPEKDFFLNYDDTEHSIRMNEQGRILCIPYSKVYHDSPGVTDGVLSWKKYYAVRNKLYAYRKHFGKRYPYILGWYYLLKAMVKAVRNHNNDEYIIVKRAIQDAKRGKLGKNEFYCPGRQSLI